MLWVHVLHVNVKHTAWEFSMFIPDLTKHEYCGTWNKHGKFEPFQVDTVETQLGISHAIFLHFWQGNSEKYKNKRENSVAQAWELPMLFSWLCLQIPILFFKFCRLPIMQNTEVTGDIPGLCTKSWRLYFVSNAVPARLLTRWQTYYV